MHIPSLNYNEVAKLAKTLLTTHESNSIGKTRLLSEG